MHGGPHLIVTPAYAPRRVLHEDSGQERSGDQLRTGGSCALSRCLQFRSATDVGSRYRLSLWGNGQMDFIALTSTVEAVYGRDQTAMLGGTIPEGFTGESTPVVPKPLSLMSNMSTDVTMQGVSLPRRPPLGMEFEKEEEEEDGISLGGSRDDSFGATGGELINKTIGDDEVPRILFEPTTQCTLPREPETSEVGSTTDGGLMATIHRLLDSDDDTSRRGSISHSSFIISSPILTIQVTASTRSDPDSTALPLDVTQTSDLPIASDSVSRLHRYLPTSSKSNLTSPSAFTNEGYPFMRPNPPSERVIPSPPLVGSSLAPREASFLDIRSRVEGDGEGSSTCVSASARTGLSLSLGKGSGVDDWKVISPRSYVPSTLHSEIRPVDERHHTDREEQEIEVTSQTLLVSRVSLGKEENGNKQDQLGAQMQAASRPITTFTEVEIPMNETQGSLQSVSRTLSWLQDITATHDVDLAENVQRGALVHPIYAPRPRRAEPPFLNMTPGRVKEFMPRFTHHNRIPRSTMINEFEFSWPPVPPLPPYGITPTAYHLLLLLAEARRCFNLMADHPIPQLTASLYLIWEERWAIAMAYSNAIDDTPGSSVLRSLLEKRQLDGGNPVRVWESPLWGLLEGLYLDGLVSIEETFV
ncbi:hypothetical protein PQX77_019019 [Marasmius sp. AFHP31]|nr:hypothetical protein PQX77_019019 [Marasmius sp. AFHP31]